jgi:sRNA-binding regulator protein Hfq
MTNQKAQTVLNIFFLNDIQAKTKIRMFDVYGLHQIIVNFEVRHHEYFDELGVLRKRFANFD